MKKLAIAVILGSLLCTGDVMSSENYKPREFWDNTEVVKSTLEKAFNIAQSQLKRRRFRCSGDKDRFLACEITNDIYQSVASEQNCLTTLSKEEFLTSLDLRGLDEVEWVPWEHVRNFLSYVRSTLGKKTH
jgi:hypothetical protein